MFFEAEDGIRDRCGTGVLTCATPILQGGVYNLASANTITTPVSLGNVHVGGTFGTSTLSLLNTAAAGAFSEGMRGQLGTVCGGGRAVGGSVSNLLAGAGDSSTLVVGLGGAAN